MVFPIHQYELAIRHTCVPSILKPSPHFSPHLTLPGLHRTLALGALLYTLNSHWLSILHMVIYPIQCFSLKSSYPLH